MNIRLRAPCEIKIWRFPKVNAQYEAKEGVNVQNVNLYVQAYTCAYMST